MKRVVCVVLVCSFFFAAFGCSKKASADKPSEPITIFPKQSSTNGNSDSFPEAEQETEIRSSALESTRRAEESTTASVNKTYGTVATKMDSAEIVDEAPEYRSEQSYKFENVALNYCKDALHKSLQKYSSIQILDGNIFFCANDTKNEYYSVYLSASYKVDTGEKIERGFFYDVGVDCTSKKAFDASKVIMDVIAKYSIYDSGDFVSELYISNEDKPFESAAVDAVKKHLKYPDTSKLVSCERCESQSITGDVQVYRVVFEAENSYKESIPYEYFVGIIQSGPGEYREVDPMDYGFEKSF